MSKSIHETRKNLRGLTKQEIEEQLNDPDSTIHKLAEKNSLKKEVKKQRKMAKQPKPKDTNNFEFVERILKDYV